jgi:cellulose synthase/poly-beta-1,6-N-acetylglucosamine synthase-like glycosyltransferase
MVFETSKSPPQFSPFSFYPHVSVIIPIYNGEADVPDLLKCLHAQTYLVDRVEYLLVDNNSTDRTFERLQSQITHYPTTNFRVLQETSIQSSYAARNTGIRQAKGEILAFTDADCRPEADWLEQLVQPFNQSAIGLVAGEILALPGNTLLERYAERHQTLSQRHTLAHPFSPYGQTANLAIRCSVVEQVGLFRPYLTTGGDADLCWRTLSQGHWQIQLAEHAIVRHRHRSTLAELRSQWRRYGQSNRYLHDLHGVGLTKAMSWQNSLHRWGRWLLKEIPLSALAGLRSQSRDSLPEQVPFSAIVLDRLIDTPLDLMCRHARTQGQLQAQLPRLARQIVWLPQTPPEQEFKDSETK